MFDIKEYYNNEYSLNYQVHDIGDIDADISSDIDSLLDNRFNSLYIRDRYKHSSSIIEIIHPRLQYPGTHSLILTPDKIRYLLSFYPEKKNLSKIDKIVLRPRFIEIGNIELVSLFLRSKKTLILYLFHPHFYKAELPDEPNEFIAIDLEKIVSSSLMDNTVRKDDESAMSIHPLWHLLNIIPDNTDEKIDKFFIKKDIINDSTYQVLNDISFYYSRHGY